MKILAVCGSGLGSSMMLEMNVKDVLKKMGVSGVEVEHSDLSGVTKDMADYIICGKDIANAMGRFDNIIALDSILSKQELTEKLTIVLKDNKIIE
ncbi:MAG: PTS sugar transporter subunit IIB [Treponema sp.]|nr:PTS sugar transporter subunit IIB [Treponema sp.]